MGGGPKLGHCIRPHHGSDRRACVYPTSYRYLQGNIRASKQKDGGIQSSIPVEVKLALPFGQLAELARAYYPGVPELAVECARQALQPEVLSRSSETSGISTILEYIQKDHMLDLDIIVQLLIRTGRQLDIGVSLE